MLFAAASVMNASWNAESIKRMRANAMGILESCFLYMMMIRRITNALSCVSSFVVECAIRTAIAV